jgi:hypothetical protein
MYATKFNQLVPNKKASYSAGTYYGDLFLGQIHHFS